MKHNIDNKKFVTVWQQATNVEEVAKAFNITNEYARVKAYDLRKRGVNLKRFREATMNVSELAQLADDLGGSDA